MGEHLAFERYQRSGKWKDGKNYEELLEVKEELEIQKNTCIRQTRHVTYKGQDPRCHIEKLMESRCSTHWINESKQQESPKEILKIIMEYQWFVIHWSNYCWGLFSSFMTWSSKALSTKVTLDSILPYLTLPTFASTLFWFWNYLLLFVSFSVYQANNSFVQFLKNLKIQTMASKLMKADLQMLIV